MHGNKAACLRDRSVSTVRTYVQYFVIGPACLLQRGWTTNAASLASLPRPTPSIWNAGIAKNIHDFRNTGMVRYKSEVAWNSILVRYFKMPESFSVDFGCNTENNKKNTGILRDLDRKRSVRDVQPRASFPPEFLRSYTISDRSPNKLSLYAWVQSFEKKSKKHIYIIGNFPT